MYPDKELEARLAGAYHKVKMWDEVYGLLCTHSDIMYGMRCKWAKQWQLDNGAKIDPASDLPEVEKKKLVLEYNDAELRYNKRQEAVSRSLRRINNYLIDVVLHAVGAPEGESNG